MLEVADPAMEATVGRVFRGVAPGPFDAAGLMGRVDRLYATGLVDGVWPRVERRAAGGDVLVVRVDAVPRRSLARHRLSARCLLH